MKNLKSKHSHTHACAHTCAHTRSDDSQEGLRLKQSPIMQANLGKFPPGGKDIIEGNWHNDVSVEFFEDLEEKTGLDWYELHSWLH